MIMPPYALNLPPMYRLRQSFDGTRLDDVEAAVDRAMRDSGVRIPPGVEIAISAGSRGIANIARILRRVADNVRAAGATPFIVPAMGSHGGATAAGQKEMLGEFGITEAAMDCEIRSEMEPVVLPSGPCPIPVYFDRNAMAAFGTIVVNRVKIHTCFHGPYESGLVKMMAIGLGKHKQALAIHGHGTKGMIEYMPMVGAQVLRHANVMMGIGIVENAYDQTRHIEAFPADRILAEEPRLLAMARANMPKLPLDEVDIVVIDRMGKNLSGTGMDGNLINRLGVHDYPDAPTPKIGIVVVRDLTPESHGNALGVGLADITTRRLFDKIDFKPFYENLYTSTYLPRGKIPVVCESDWECLAFAARCATGKRNDELRILRIDSTLHVDRLHASQAAVDALAGHPRVAVEGRIEGDYFDAAGAMCGL
jgi:hypothetical protein